MEDVVTEYQGDFVGTDEFFTDDECLRKAVWVGLDRILQADTPLGTVAEQALEL